MEYMFYVKKKNIASIGHPAGARKNEGVSRTWESNIFPLIQVAQAMYSAYNFGTTSPVIYPIV